MANFNFSPIDITAKGPSSSDTPYILPQASGVNVTSVLTVGDNINGYKMVGIPDGLGAFDNGDGTFTLLMNQELGSTSGIARAHGGAGAFVSSWIIDKATLEVKSGQDLIQSVYGWDATAQKSSVTPVTTPINFSRFCSADLAAPTAFYNAATGKGSQARIFLNGEEGGSTGYALANIASGTAKGSTYILGNFNLATNGSGGTAVGGWENLLANPFAQDKTIVIGNNDGGTGIMNNSVVVYVGTKQTTGSEADKAGLTNGTIKFVNVTGNPVEIVNTTTRATNITSGSRFTLSDTPTTFSRPEDGAWDPLNPQQYYFVTTDRLDQVADGVGAQIGRSRLWRLTFDDITDPSKGGTIDMLLDGTEGGNMFDNITIDRYGHILLLEDVGNADHLGKVWEYTIATDTLKEIAQHDPVRFGNVVNGVVTPATAPFTKDEESSGIVDAQDILGPGWFLLDTQAHYTNTDPALVEGGQLQALFNPDTYNSYLASQSVTEGMNVQNGKLTTSGTLAAFGTQGFDPNKVTPDSGNLGTLTITAQREFTYTVDNSKVESLGAGQTKVDTFTIIPPDGGASQVLKVTVNGVKAGFSGVAAGDMTSNDAIIWTRTFDTATGKGITEDVTLELSTDKNFGTIAKTFTGTTRDANHDYTLKINATGLNSNTQYYYRFKAQDSEVSPVGTFKTAPAATDVVAVKFGFSGDANGQWRPYNSIQGLASLNLDYFVFLGDTIYETASTGSPAAVSPVTDANANQALIDYHRKYLENIQSVNANGAQSLEALFTAQGNYTLLDNHELGNKQLMNGGAPAALVNDSAVNGKSGASAAMGYDVNTTGIFINQTAAFKALVQAYSDYQPIREVTVAAPNDPRSNGTQQLYYAQQWGKNDLFINVDDRSYRDVRLKTTDTNGKLTNTDDITSDRGSNPDRTMLGATQLAWLKQTLLNAQTNDTVWKFIAVSSPIDQVGDGQDGGKSWISGYKAERNDLLKFIADNHIQNVVFLSTDDHQSRVNELTYTDADGKTQVVPTAFTIVTGPIGADGPDTVTDHSFGNISNLAATLVNAEQNEGINPIGLDPNFHGLSNVWRKDDPNVNATAGYIDAQNIRPVDFYSPDTFNYTTFDIAADGTLNVNVAGINSYAPNTFPEPTTAASSIFKFSITPNHVPVLENGADSVERDTIEDTKNGDLVGTPIAVVDADSDPITFSLGETDPNDPQKNGLNAFTIDSSTGQIKVKNAEYLKNQSVFNLTVTAQDPTGVSDTIGVKINVDSSNLQQPNPTITPGIFSISSLSIQNLLVTLQNNVNVSIGLFLVDAPDGSIVVDGKTYKPGESSYNKEAIKRALGLLSALTGTKTFSPGQLKKILGLKDAAALVSPNHQGNFYFGFLAVSDGTLGGLAQGFGSATLSTDKSGITITSNNDGSYNITLGSNTFTLQSTTKTPVFDDPAGLHAKGSGIDELVTSVISDLTGKSGRYAVTAIASRDAAFDNILGFFAVDNNGDVLKSDGTVAANGTLANSDDYRKAITDNLLNSNQLIKLANGQTQTFTFNVDVKDDVKNAGFQILPVLGVKVTSFSTLAPTIYYPILGINSDKFDRMVVQGVDSTGLRVYGFEDLPNGGDKDFNDFTVRIQVSPVNA